MSNPQVCAMTNDSRQFSWHTPTPNPQKVRMFLYVGLIYVNQYEKLIYAFGISQIGSDSNRLIERFAKGQSRFQAPFHKF